VIGGRLLLHVADDGPGLPDGVASIGNGRGVGLRNTRERLQVLYGDRQPASSRFNTKPGLRIDIEITCRVRLVAAVQRHDHTPYPHAHRRRRARSRGAGSSCASPRRRTSRSSASARTAARRSEINELQPDLMFLDIQMPGLSGFDVLAQMPQDAVPVIVFVTAFDRYAIDAFEARALDYLLKPVEDSRLMLALDRVREHLKHARAGAQHAQLMGLLADVNGAGEIDPDALPSASRAWRRAIRTSCRSAPAARRSA
jgi:CheY-like chemotaxis protein